MQIKFTVFFSTIAMMFALTRVPCEGQDTPNSIKSGNLTNGIRAMLFVPDDLHDPIFIGVVSETLTENRWVMPTNDVPCRVRLSDEKGTILTPTNDVITESSYLRRKWTISAYPYHPTRSRPSMYKTLFKGNTFLFFLDLGKYYDLSKVKKFTLEVSPLLYDNQFESNKLILIELPSAKYTATMTGLKEIGGTNRE